MSKKCVRSSRYINKAMDNKQRKEQLRKEIKEKAKQLPMADTKEADAKIADKVVSLPEFVKAKTVFCFVSTKEEINTFPILKQVLSMGKTLVVPKCGAPGIMDVCQLDDLQDLEVGAYGILEPVKECRLAAREEIDFAVIPCLSCDKNGGRLGHGGGYYDRYLEQRSYPAVALCRDVLLSEKVPMEKWDQRMDVVITETQVYKK